MHFLYPTSSVDNIEEFQELFQVSRTDAFLLDLHISTAGLIALPSSFYSKADYGFSNYRFLVQERIQRKGEVSAFFKEIVEMQIRKEGLNISVQGEANAYQSVPLSKVGLSHKSILAPPFFKELTVSLIKVDRKKSVEISVSKPKTECPLALLYVLSSLNAKEITDLISQSKCFEVGSFEFNEDEENLALSQNCYYAQCTWPNLPGFLSSRGGNVFNWPDLEVVRNDGASPQSQVSASDFGLFKQIGFCVGARSLPRDERRKQLSWYLDCECEELRRRNLSPYWIDYSKTERLAKLAQKFAFHIRTARSSSVLDKRDAIANWTEDLEWLYETRYLPLRSPFFQWPEV